MVTQQILAATPDFIQQQQQQPLKSSKTKTTTTTTTTTLYKTTLDHLNRGRSTTEPPASGEVAVVRDLGRKASIDNVSQARTVSRLAVQKETTVSQLESSANEEEEEFDGNRLVTTISTIAAMSGQSRLVVAVLKDGASARLKIQDMRPSFFDVGNNKQECLKYLEEHQRLIDRLSNQKKSALECWLEKYRIIGNTREPNMSKERKLVYMCMLENLQACWKSLMGHLNKRRQLLEQTVAFYAECHQLSEALDRSERHIQVFREEFLRGPGSANFEEACRELVDLNGRAEELYVAAKRYQQSLIDRVMELERSNLGDARPAEKLASESRALLDYINRYLDPLQRRRLKLESVLSVTSNTEQLNFTRASRIKEGEQQVISTVAGKNHSLQDTTLTATKLATTSSSSRNTMTAPDSCKRQPQMQTGAGAGNKLRLLEISNFSDLDLIEGWLQTKVEQLNSSLLSSLGISAPDTRSIVAKHEQIALECRALQEATQTFNGRHIHSIKPQELAATNSKQDDNAVDKPISCPTTNQLLLLERQRDLADKVCDLISLVEARIALLRRTIDFYQRALEADSDIQRMMQRLQVDNSLPSVQLVTNELELKDVSSVIASGGTIISELQQLQLAQHHGHQPRIVNLDLATTGIRTVVDQLSQELGQLKSELGQRKLKLLNEDSAKTAHSFATKCGQLQCWLNSHARGHLLTSGRVPRDYAGASQFCDSSEQVRADLQAKTLEIEALLRSLSSLSKNLESHHHQASKMGGAGPTADELQRSVDRLRREWIEVTNCLDRRIELVKKYLATLSAARALDKELDALESFHSGLQEMPLDRTEEDIRSNIEQSSLQLVNRVRNFESDARSLKTDLVYSQNGLRSLNDLNKEELINEANNTLKHMRLRRDAINQRESRRDTSKSSLPAHRRPQQVDPPRFTRVLQDKLVEPFSTVELECETDDAQCQVEWLMNNMKQIPASIKHSQLSERNHHKLIIKNFSSICCGTYVARASNGAGQTCCQCKLRLLGIKEITDDEPAAASSSVAQQQQQQQHLFQQQPSSSHSLTQQQAPEVASWQQAGNQQANTRHTIERVIRGVEQPDSPVNQIRITQLASDSETETIDQHSIQTPLKTPIVGHSTSSTTHQQTTSTTTNKPTRPQAVPAAANYIVDSPTTSSTASNANFTTLTNNNNNNNNLNVTTTNSRSVSKSPYDGTPQPPVFLQGLSDSMPRSCSRAGLVCLVVGNPPPTIEWLHNDQMIATAKCPRTPNSPRSNLCKLTIETINPHTQGHYVCRASNPIGQTTTSLTLTK